jgi:uncharacterized membrane protein (DUF106 family)
MSEEETPTPIIKVVQNPAVMIVLIVVLVAFGLFQAYTYFFPVETEKVKELNERIKFQGDSLEKAYISRDSAVIALQPFQDSITSLQVRIDQMETELVNRILNKEAIKKQFDVPRKEIELGSSSKQLEVIKKHLQQ